MKSIILIKATKILYNSNSYECVFWYRIKLNKFYSVDRNLKNNLCGLYRMGIPYNSPFWGTFKKNDRCTSFQKIRNGGHLDKLYKEASEY